MNAAQLVRILLESDDQQRSDLIARLKQEGYEFIEAVKFGDYDMLLWKGHKTRDGKSVEFYEVSLSHNGLPFDKETDQLGRQPGGGSLAMHLGEMANALENWLSKVGKLYIGSYDSRKLGVYAHMLEHYTHRIHASKPFAAFDDSTGPDYFTITL